MDNLTNLVVNPTYNYAISCADYFEYRIQTIPKVYVLGALELCGMNYIYQFFIDLYSNESQFDVSTGYLNYSYIDDCDDSNWWLQYGIEKCCLHLFLKLGLLLDMIKLYEFEQNDKTIKKDIRNEILHLQSKHKNYF